MRRLRHQVFHLIGCVLISGALCCSCSDSRRQPPLSPEQALKSFLLNEEFRIELYASEPYVTDPVELVFDENGRAWVAEMRDYPEDPPPGKPARGRIRRLEDRDGDGRVDRSTIFAEGLLQVTSLLPWKGGLMVTAAPDILYLKDTNGDGKADMRRVLFTGFALANPESRITNLRFGIDNWIYASNHGQRGTITFTERPDAPPVSVLGADFRFRLDRGLFEAESGPTQFGQAMNDWGQRFITENTVHVRHVVIPRRYLARNLFLMVGEAAQNISDHGRPSSPVFQLTRPQYWREARTQMRQQRYRENQLDRLRPLNPSTEIVAGFFTGASGGTIYTGDTFAGPYRGNLFTGDVAANLVHRDVLRPQGVTFVASRAEGEKGREFLASTDQWFRPCNFTIGPDGNLYVVDIYREFIETPESIPEELKKDMDFYSGDTLGRIYRIVGRNGPRVGSLKPNLGSVPADQLARLLSHPNGWWRLTAQRLILERQDRSVIPTLRKMATEEEAAQARLHALYSLEGLSSLDSGLVAAAMKDPHPAVREHALQWAERFPELLNQLAGMVADPDPRVAFQLALSWGEFPPPQSLRPLAALTSQYVEDRWFRIAILSSRAGSSAELLKTLLSEQRFFEQPSRGKEEFLRQLASVIGARNDAEEIAAYFKLVAASTALGAEHWQEAGLSGLARGLQLADVRRLKIKGVAALLARLLSSRSEKVQSAARAVARHFEVGGMVSMFARQALDTRLPASQRKAAIRALAGGDFEQLRPMFEKLLDTETDSKLVAETFAALAFFDDAAVGRLIVARWKRLLPALRNAALDVLLDHRGRQPVLLEALERGRVERTALDLQRKEKLLRNPDAQISERARRIFRDETSDRSQIVEGYRAVLTMAGNAERGRGVFEKQCASCHLSRGGKRVGPDLSGVSSQTKAQLLQGILDPSRAMDARYTNYIVITREGRIHDGIVAAETPGVLTLRRGEGEDDTILRSNIVEIRASSVSLMPDGLEKSIPRQEMADLIAFLQGANLRHQH